MTEPAGDDPDDLAQADLAAMRVLTQARAWAFFAIGDSGARLLASDKIDRCCLDAVVTLAGTHGAPALAALAHEAADDSPRSRLLLAFPHAGPRDHGLLYLEGPPAHVPLGLLLNLLGRELEALLRLNVGTPTAVLAPVETAATTGEPEALRALLEQHEWSVARVARLLGVTRMTVYNRMRRYGVLRTKLEETPPPGERGPEHP